MSMKKLLLPLILLFATYCIGQNNGMYTSFGKPLPDWVNSAPIPTNDTYYYKVFKGTGITELEARNQAVAMAFQQADAYTGTRVNVSDIYKALEKGTSIEVMSSTFSIPIYIACEASKKNKDGAWNYWLLCQIATKGNITPLFNRHFDGCNTYTNFGKLKKRYDARAIAASTFIPGMGQMLKGQYGAGCGFLFSELALFCGGTACYFLADKQNDIMTKRGTSYDDYNAAKNKKNTYNIAMYCCFGAGAALHIANMCHAYMCFDKKLAKRLSAFEPAIIPINEYSQPNYALGISWHHDF